MLESIERYRDLFLVTYTVEADSTFCGYTKICADKPPSPWEVDFPIRKLTSGECPEEREAHDKAIEAARGFLDKVFEAAAARVLGD